jgi:hypothetical protein
MIIRLASSGPKIQIHLEQETPQAKLKTNLGKRSFSRKPGSDEAKDTLIDTKSRQVEDSN